MITKREFADEERRIRKLRREGKDKRFIKSWLRGWRSAARLRKRG